MAVPAGLDGSERPTVLVDLATARLVDRQIPLLGITTLTRLARGPGPADRRSWRRVVTQLDDADRDRIEGLLDGEPDTGLSVLDRLRRPPRRRPSTAWSKPSTASPRYNGSEVGDASAWSGSRPGGSLPSPPTPGLPAAHGG